MILASAISIMLLVIDLFIWVIALVIGNQRVISGPPDIC